MHTQLNGSNGIDRKSEQPKNTIKKMKRIQRIKHKEMHRRKPSRRYYGEKAQENVNADHEHLRHMRRQPQKIVCPKVKNGCYTQS